MSDNPTGKQQPATQPGTNRKTTTGPHGGGTQYTQMRPTLGKGFIAIPPITGHRQKKNISDKG